MGWEIKVNRNGLWQYMKSKCWIKLITLPEFKVCDFGLSPLLLKVIIGHKTFVCWTIFKLFTANLCYVIKKKKQIIVWICIKHASRRWCTDYCKNYKITDNRKICCYHPKIWTRWSNVSKKCSWNGKQCKSWSDCSSIQVYTVCTDLSVQKFRIINSIKDGPNRQLD